MPDNPNHNDQQDKHPEWFFVFETFGENVSQWMSQMGIGTDADLQVTHLSAPLASADAARIRLDLTIGRATIGALPPDSDHLIEMDVTSIGAVEMLTTTENGSQSVRVRQKRSTRDLLKPVKDVVDAVAHNTELQWDIRLSPRLPLNLLIHAGLTVDDFDLSALTVPQLTLDGGAGRTVITLPAGTCKAEIDGGVGLLDIGVPAGAHATLNTKLGAGATHLRIGPAAAVRADIIGGVGNCEIDIPPDAALRVQGESGLGNFDVPPRAKPVTYETEFVSESGTWQTDEYTFAEQQIDIRYEGGVGSLIIREPS
jgi:hypothetical protein